MSKPQIEMKVSILSAKETLVAKLLMSLIDAFDALSPASRENVVARWEMLHLITPQETKQFMAWWKRINRVEP